MPFIQGHKPSGYVATADNKVVGETRQCSHCQYTWVYAPGSKRKYGMCMKCMGLLCTRCVMTKAKVVDYCAPFAEVGADDWMKKYTFNPQLNIFLKK